MHNQIQKIAASAKQVLISPLDWGLGHATRCIPIIKALLKHNIKVYIATTGKIETLLKAEFPQVHFLTLKGYNIKYSKNAKWFAFNILKQVPKILNIIRHEHRWLEKTIIEYNIDYVISDNRFGLYTKKVPCVFITHQLYIKTNMGKLIENFIQHFNYKYINRFTACWIPDTANDPSLGGMLSHPKKMPFIPVHYIGPISRFHILPHTPPIIYKAVILLSGPEPQRTILEKLIQQQAASVQDQFVLIRALPEEAVKLDMPHNWQVFNHLPAEKLNILLQQAEYIISRTGYTTIMDIWVLKKKCILIPTPGQPEQEYLGKTLFNKGFNAVFSQKTFNLTNTLNNTYYYFL